MGMRFQGKRLRRKVIRPIKNSMLYPSGHDTIDINGNVAEGTFDAVDTEQMKDINAEETVEQEVEDTEELDAPKKNNKKKNNKKMDANVLNKVENMTGIANPTVKVEKKDKSLIERTEESVVVLTEDNKMLLND